MDIIPIDLPDAGNDAFEAANNMGNIASTNSGASGESIMLLTNQNSDIVSHETHLRNILNSNEEFVIPIMERSSTNQFVNAYHNNEMFWEKSNVFVFPYGRGGPSDVHPYGELSMNNFHAHALQQGVNDKRRCQASPSYYFLAYETELKRLCGSVSYLAAQQHGVVNPEDNISIEDLGDVQTYLNKPSGTGFTEAEILMPDSNIEKDKRIKALIRKMMPYSRPLDGTAPMLAQERKKLLCLLTAPAVVSTGQWRWFITFAMPDLFDPKLFDILDGLVGNLETDSLWTLEKRLEAVRRSPGLIARLFKIKQHCIFKYLIGGQNKPFGEVQDYWLRNEFQARGTVHMHGLVSETFNWNDIFYYACLCIVEMCCSFAW